MTYRCRHIQQGMRNARERLRYPTAPLILGYLWGI